MGRCVSFKIKQEVGAASVDWTSDLVQALVSDLVQALVQAQWCVSRCNFSVFLILYIFYSVMMSMF